VGGSSGLILGRSSGADHTTPKAEKEQVGHAADPGELEGEDCNLLVDLQGPGADFG
jgi:hypothetical protein